MLDVLEAEGAWTDGPTTARWLMSSPPAEHERVMLTEGVRALRDGMRGSRAGQEEGHPRAPKLLVSLQSFPRAGQAWESWPEGVRWVRLWDLSPEGCEQKRAALPLPVTGAVEAKVMGFKPWGAKPSV